MKLIPKRTLHEPEANHSRRRDKADSISLWPAPPPHVGGYMLIECLVYISALLILLGLGYAAFYRCLENSVALRRSADDIANALHAGERWRADLRAANGTIRVEGTSRDQILHLPGARGGVAYQFSTNVVLRRVGSGPWTRLLANVKSSSMESDPRPSVVAWRWELELKPRSKRLGRVRPLFTFIAVPERSSTK